MTARPVIRKRPARPDFLDRKKPEEIADYEAWARFTRQALGWSDITADDDPIVSTPFRSQIHLIYDKDKNYKGRFTFRPRTASQLRQIAAGQVAEARREP